MKILEEPSTELWTEVAGGCSHATFFHTPAWARIVERSVPAWKVSARAYMFDDGTSAILPLMKSGGLLGKHYNSMPFGVYGGPISRGELTTGNLESIFRSFSLPLGRIDVTGNPLFEFELPDGYHRREDSTHILRLDQGFGAIWKGFSKGHKSSAKKSERMGVQIGLAESIEDYREYYSVYEDSLRRWGDRATSRYEFELFRNIFEESIPEIQLWLARLDGRVISGALNFHWNEHIVWWHGASLEEYFEYCAPNLLIVEAIKDGCNRGCAWFDFNPSGGHEGVARFKKSFGAEKRQILRWHRKQNLLRDMIMPWSRRK